MPMTTEQAREVFNQAIAQTTDIDKITELEVCREYFTNPEFRKAMSDTIWAMVNGR